MNEKFMRDASRISIQKMRANHGGPSGAVVVRHGKIVGHGWNRVTSTNDPTAHAEINAIRNACRRLKTVHLRDCELYTSCEPCPMCLAAIYWARLSKVFYGNTRRDVVKTKFEGDWIYREITKPISKQRIPMKQLLPTEAIKAFAEWGKKKDKLLY